MEFTEDRAVALTKPGALLSAQTMKTFTSFPFLRFSPIHAIGLPLHLYYRSIFFKSLWSLIAKHV